MRFDHEGRRRHELQVRSNNVPWSSWEEGSLRFDSDAFERIVHYICWTCEDPRVLSFLKLNRVLWYFERNACLATKRPFTGATFAKSPDGPLAVPAPAAIQHLIQQKRIVERNSTIDPDRGRYFAVDEPNLSGIDARQLSSLEAIVRAVCFGTNTTIPHKTGIDRIFELVRFGEDVLYFTVFAGFDAALSGDDIEWAIRAVTTVDRDNFDPMIEMNENITPFIDLAFRAAIWRLRRESDIGISLPIRNASHFIYKQDGHRFGLPDLTIVYTFSLDQLIVTALRLQNKAVDDGDEQFDRTLHIGENRQPHSWA